MVRVTKITNRYLQYTLIYIICINRKNNNIHRKIFGRKNVSTTLVTLNNSMLYNILVPEYYYIL